MGRLARFQDGIPVVANNAERAALVPSPTLHQRVQNLASGAVERWTGSAWVPDWRSIAGSQYGRLYGTRQSAQASLSELIFSFPLADAFASSKLQLVTGAAARIIVLAGGEGLYSVSAAAGNGGTGFYHGILLRTTVVRAGPSFWQDEVSLALQSFVPATWSGTLYGVQAYGIIPLFAGDAVQMSLMFEDTTAAARAFTGRLSIAQITPLAPL